jgi:hypothetical protein
VNTEDDSTVTDVYLLCEGNHERLAKEFVSTAACVPVEIPNKEVNAIKFETDSRGDGLILMFVDIYSLSPKENEIPVFEMKTLLDYIGKLVKEKRTLIHIKADVISRAIASMLSHDRHCINGEELKTFLHGQEQAIIKSHLTGEMIRRLNKNNVASNCPLTNYPARYIQFSLDTDERKEICRFYNYDERGCLRSIKAKLNPRLKGCEMCHEHCHRCGFEGHRAFECTREVRTDTCDSVVFQKNEEGEIIAVPLHRDQLTTKASDVSVPSLLVLGGRCRGRTLNSCEFLPLLSPNGSWTALPNLQEHRGSHAACSPKGTRLTFVVGGGGVDGNLDTVELLDLRTGKEEDFIRWSKLSDSLASARHAFGSVCVTKANADEVCVDLYAVGGWMYGTKSCESMEKLSFKISRSCSELDWQRNARWEKCSPILTPRRLHSVAASIDGSSIFVFGGYVDERNVTSSIESYNISTDSWNATDELPYPTTSCPLVQAVPDWSPDVENKNSFLIFPYSDNNTGDNCTPVVLRYSPHSAKKFEPVVVTNTGETHVEHLQMPIKNWHSYSATISPSLRKAYLVGGLIDSKWTGRGFSLDLKTMKWRELPEMSLPRRRLAALVME